MTRRCDPAAAARDLDASLPPGLDVLDVVEARARSLADRLEASEWEMRLPGVDPADAGEAVEAFLAAETVSRSSA